MKQICDEDNIPLIYFDVIKKQFLIEDSDIFINTTLTGEFSTLFHSNFNYVSLLDSETQIKENFEDLKKDINENINSSFCNIIVDKKGIGPNERKLIETKIDREFDIEKCISINNPNTSFLMRKNSNIVNYFKINQKNYFSYYDTEKNEIITNSINDGIIMETDMFKINQLKVLYLKKKRNIRNKNEQNSFEKEKKKKRSHSVKK